MIIKTPSGIVYECKSNLPIKKKLDLLLKIAEHVETYKFFNKKN